MRKSGFDSFCASIRRAFDRVNGAVARCRNKRWRNTVTVTAGIASNNKITVEKVSVWGPDDTLLYCGPLQNRELCKVLTAAKVCGAELTNSVNMDDSRGKVCCYGDPETCTVEQCPFKKAASRRS